MYFLIPREVFADAAILWMAAVDEATGVAQLALAADAPGSQTAQPWEKWPLDSQNPRVQHREVRIDGLTPRQTYSFTLLARGASVASAKVTTLPSTMPLLGEKPFTVLLGSCFAYLEDEEGKVGNTFFHLPYPARPDVKFFAGDQVYLDSPWYRYLMPHSPDELRDAFVEHYTRTWAQADGFARLLGEGANFFCSDDHEYWNNAPNAAVYAQDTWTAAGRQVWLKAARDLYCAFQTPRFFAPFSVAPVSFLLVDTRVNRDADRQNFMQPGDLTQVANWVNALNGPGVLVIGQPLLQTSTGFFKGHFGDWNLPDFKQYHQLVDIVGGSRHSLVILTGDVHYGRIARSSLRSGAELIEIISSPLSLVDETAKGKWEKAPPVFPTVRPETTTPARLARSQVVTEGNFSPNEGHFLTLEFTRRGPGAYLRLRFWPVFKGSTPPPTFGKTVWERTLA